MGSFICLFNKYRIEHLLLGGPCSGCWGFAQGARLEIRCLTPAWPSALSNRPTFPPLPEPSPPGCQGFPRAAAPVGVFSRGTTRISGSLSCGAREVRSPCAWRGGARHGSGLPELGWLCTTVQGSPRTSAQGLPLAPHDTLPEILVVPREKTPTGAAARGNP